MSAVVWRLIVAAVGRDCLRRSDRLSQQGKVFLRDIIDLEATYAGPDAKDMPAPEIGPDGGYFGSTLGGSMGKGRERQIILKTDQRNVILELGLGENSKQNQAAGTRTEPFSKAMFVKLQYAMAAGC
jgi:hypothetical protein